MIASKVDGFGISITIRATGVLWSCRTDIIYCNELGRKILIAVCSNLEAAAHALLIGHARFFLLPTDAAN